MRNDPEGQGRDVVEGKRTGKAREPDPRRRILADLYVKDPIGPKRPLIERAGFSPWTARIPGQKALTRADVLPLALREPGAPTLSSLEKKALKTLDKVLSRDDPGQTEASTAGGVLRLKREFGEDEDPNALTDADHMNARRSALRFVYLGVLLAARMGPQAAQARVDEASLRELGAPLHDLPRAFHDVPQPGMPLYNRRS